MCNVETFWPNDLKVGGASPDSDLPVWKKVPHYSKLLLLMVSIVIIIKTIMSGCIFIYYVLLLPAPIFRNKSKNKRAILETSPSWCHKWHWYLAGIPQSGVSSAFWNCLFLSPSKRGIYKATFPVGSPNLTFLQKAVNWGPSTLISEDV